LRHISSSYIKDLKSANAEVGKRLETSKSQVTGLEKDLEVARLSIKERERELAGLKLEINNQDERIRLLLVQLHCSCVGHVTLSGDNVTKRAQAPVASPD
jgi:hypothetical protein